MEEKCPICQSEDFKKEGDYYECESCGNTFSQLDINLREKTVTYTGGVITSINDFMNNAIG